VPLAALTAAESTASACHWFQKSSMLSRMVVSSAAASKFARLWRPSQTALPTASNAALV